MLFSFNNLKFEDKTKNNFNVKINNFTDLKTIIL